LILLAVAPNGAKITKQDHPAVPLSIEEIAQEAKSCMDAGAGMIHLHVRNNIGQHSLNTKYYHAAIAAIKEQVADGLFIQVTSEAVGKYTPDEQFEMIHQLKPEGVSIAIREIRRMDELDLYEHFSRMRDNNTYPQLILYNKHDVSTYMSWLEDGLLPGNAYPVLIVIGKAQKEGLFTMDSLGELDDLGCSSWMVCAFGEQEYQAGLIAAQKGGHIRIGFENNQCLTDGRIAASNAEIVAQMAEALVAEGKVLASASEARKIMRPDW